MLYIDIHHIKEKPLKITHFFKGFSFIWNYLLCTLVYHYFTLRSLLDFELRGYCRKKI